MNPPKGIVYIIENTGTDKDPRHGFWHRLNEAKAAFELLIWNVRYFWRMEIRGTIILK